MFGWAAEPEGSWEVDGAVGGAVEGGVGSRLRLFAPLAFGSRMSSRAAAMSAAEDKQQRALKRQLCASVRSAGPRHLVRRMVHQMTAIGFGANGLRRLNSHWKAWHTV